MLDIAFLISLKVNDLWKFSKIARLARNTRELLQIADIFKEHNADLVSLQESIDISSPAGRFFYTLISAMAQWGHNPCQGVSSKFLCQ